MNRSQNWLQNPLEEFRRWRMDNPYYGEKLRASLRLLFALFIIDNFALAGMAIFGPGSPISEAQRIHDTHLILRFVHPLLIVPLTPFSSPDFFRYLLPPITVLVFLLIAGSMYVQDIYGLEDFRPAFQHVFSSMFGLNYPRIRIDGGAIQKRGNLENPLETIGGPGFALIQPGNAVTFRHLRRPSRASLTGSYFMMPFETIGQIVSLDDQHGYKDKMEAITRDGIQVVLREVHFRFRILTEESQGRPVLRTLQNPYPFSVEAMRSMAINLAVDEKGNTDWASAVQRTVIGAIAGYIGSHSIDQITAPGKDGADPRREIRSEVFAGGVRGRLKEIGAELIWIDIGHFDIAEETVDKERLDLWATKWIGDANRARAFGEAKRLIYQELGRAEASAEMVMSIMDAVEGVDFSQDPAENLRNLLLVRTSQILDSISDSQADKSEKK